MLLEATKLSREGQSKGLFTIGISQKGILTNQPFCNLSKTSFCIAVLLVICNASRVCSVAMKF